MMKSSYHPDTTSRDTFAPIVLACFLALVAWGNALAMLVFALVALIGCVVFPDAPRRNETIEHQGLLALILAAVAAFFVALMMVG